MAGAAGVAGVARTPGVAWVAGVAGVAGVAWEWDDCPEGVGCALPPWACVDAWPFGEWPCDDPPDEFACDDPPDELPWE